MESQNKVAVVTGGGQGIGKAIAKKFLQNGIKVVIAEIDEEAGKETQLELSNEGDIRFIPCDVGSESSVKNMIAEIIQQFGQLDYLINNAAISNNKPLEELSSIEWSRVIEVNLTGTFLCVKYAAPYLKQHKGALINIASTRAFMSEANTEAYSATKGGIVGLTHALSISLGPDVRVNCISPGWIDTTDWQKSSHRKKIEWSKEDHSQHPVGRVGIPNDVASLALFLVSPENSFITGANFIVDGGMTRKMIYV